MKVGQEIIIIFVKYN